MALITRQRLLARAATTILMAAGLSACSSIPDWVDPTTWFGSSDQTASDESSANPDATPPANAAQTPDIAGIPAKPAPPSTPDEQKQVAASLDADRTQANYSANSLRGGTEAAAAPPSAETGPDAGSSASPAAAATPADTSTAGASAPAAEASTASAPEQASAAPVSDAGQAATAPQPAQPAATSSAEAASAQAPATQVASADTASASAPAAAPMAAETAPPANDMQATFAPSRAPALDPSVAQYVPRQILSHYQQTAAAADAQGLTGGSGAAAPVRHRHHKKAKTAADASPGAEPTSEPAATSPQ